MIVPPTEQRSKTHGARRGTPEHSDDCRVDREIWTAFKFILFAVFALAEAINAKDIRQAKAGTVIACRKWAWRSARTVPFYIDGKLVAKLKNGYYCKLELPPADYVFTHDTVLAGLDPVKVLVTAGQTSYFCKLFANMFMRGI
jgi:hypothetical protein